MKEFLDNLKNTWQYAKKQKNKLIGYMACNVFSIFISIFVPILSANVIVKLTSSEFKQVLYISLAILACELFRNLINYCSRYFAQVSYRETFTDLQSALGNEILKLENKIIDNNSSGVFIQRLTNDTSRIADIFHTLNNCLTNIITNIGIFIAIFIINKIAFFYLILMILSIYLVENRRIKLYNEQDKIYRKNRENTSGFVGELVRGVRDIKMLNAEKSFMKELNNKIQDLNSHRYAMQKVDRKYTILRGNLIDLYDTGMIFLLVVLIIKGHLGIANALVIHNYMSRVTSIVSYASMLLNAVKDFNLSSGRIFDIMKSDEFKKEEFGVKKINKVKGKISFENVSFSYNEERKIINNLNFTIKANETVAFVGKSGVGKTTIFNLLCKMYDIESGTISIDGINIQELDKESIRGNITVISQNPYIFNMSIRDNLRLVKEDLTEEEMIKACKLACLHDFINKLPNGYDTIVGEGGISLSGGQRQRLAIARAFVQKTEIILFDEATSALDNETQASIQQAIINLQKKYTILIIAHRLSTIVHSDRILFMTEKGIEAEGTHEELLATNEDYRLLYETEVSN